MSKARFLIDRLERRNGIGPTHRLQEADTGRGILVRIDPSDELELPSQFGLEPRKRKLGDLIQALSAINGVPMISQGEIRKLGLVLGNYIWNSDDRPELDELWIETVDPLAAGLPWALTRPPNALSLVEQGVSVGVRVSRELYDRAGLPLQPRLLFVGPDCGSPTRVNEHLINLVDRLPMCDIVPITSTTRNALFMALSETPPDILYYYGHGRVDRDGVLLLLMESGALSVTELADFLAGPDGRAARKQLGLVYFNCCWGGITTELGGPLRVGAQVPAFISNRASAITHAAQEQAIDILGRIIANRMPPHEAVCETVRDNRTFSGYARQIKASPDEPWWMTPTVFANYRTWDLTSPQRQPYSVFSPHETLWLDRDEHSMRTEKVVIPSGGSSAGQVTVLVWCGTEEQGLYSLGERLTYEMHRRPRVRTLCFRPVDWPSSYSRSQPLADRRRQMTDMLTAAICGYYNQGQPRMIADRARDLLGRGGGTALLQQATIDAGLLDLAASASERGELLRSMLIDFVSVLEVHVASALKQVSGVGAVNFVALVGVDAEACTGLEAFVRKACDDNPTNVRLVLLPRLESIGIDQIVYFIDDVQDRDRQVWSNRRAIAEAIHQKTKGAYEATRKELEDCSSYLL
jgi:hypothetical protein